MGHSRRGLDANECRAMHIDFYNAMSSALGLGRVMPEWLIALNDAFGDVEQSMRSLEVRAGVRGGGRIGDIIRSGHFAGSALEVRRTWRACVARAREARNAGEHKPAVLGALASVEGSLAVLGSREIVQRPLLSEVETSVLLATARAQGADGGVFDLAEVYDRLLFTTSPELGLNAQEVLAACATEAGAAGLEFDLTGEAGFTRVQLPHTGNPMLDSALVTTYGEMAIGRGAVGITLAPQHPAAPVLDPMMFR